MLYVRIIADFILRIKDKGRINLHVIVHNVKMLKLALLHLLF